MFANLTRLGLVCAVLAFAVSPARSDVKKIVLDGGLIHTRAGDIAYVELAGNWDIITRDGRFVAAPFEGTGKLVGGTGKLEGISGPVLVKGQIDGEKGGAYSAEITATY
jgi:hypothetical protein